MDFESQKIENLINFEKIPQLLKQDYTLFRVDKLTFEDKAPKKEALENVLSALRVEGASFIYIIQGDKKGINLYLGAVKDFSTNGLQLNINDVGNFILKPSIQGNFRGSTIRQLEIKEKERVRADISDFEYISYSGGVPGVFEEDDEHFQGVDRVIDVMLGDPFVIMVIAKPIGIKSIQRVESNLFEIYSKISKDVKKNIQDGDSKTKNSGKSETKSDSITTTEGDSWSKTEGSSSGKSKSTSKSDGTNSSTTEGISKGTGTSNGSSDKSNSTNEGSSESSTKGKNNTLTLQDGVNSGDSKSETVGKNKGHSTQKGDSITDSWGDAESVSKSLGWEEIDKSRESWIKYLDDVIFSRLDYGKGKGIFEFSISLYAQNRATLIKLEQTLSSLYSGKSGNKNPLQFKKDFEINNGVKISDFYKNFQIPFGKLEKKEDIMEPLLVNSQYPFGYFVTVANWISVNELSIIAGVPQKEVVGITLKEEIEFGLNFSKNIEEVALISIGKLVQSGRVFDDIDVKFPKKNLNTHTFVTGVTGAGKTTTCQKLLLESGFPFLVIEPAKTEYRDLFLKKGVDVTVFTLGKDSVVPFRLNPFQFYEHESITSRVDMIQATMEASFDMEAAIPQIIEKAIYECYEDYEWDISTNKNKKFNKPFENSEDVFPTLSDLVNKIDAVVLRQGFDERLKNDYIGSIKARLQALLIGSKGLMLNTKRSIDFRELIEKNTVLELEEIRGGREKSLIMGFILTHLIETIKWRFLRDKKQFYHITLIEEAHRLLSRFSAGDSMNKKHGVEVFTDMLAEVRKYGESIVISDQIPNRLTPEVLKNTSTKIVHKIFAKDDKDAIGNTMALTEEQSNFLSHLAIGRAIVFTEGWEKTVQVQVSPHNSFKSTLVDDILIDEESLLRKKGLEFYIESKTPVFIGFEEIFDSKPTVEELEKFLQFSTESPLLHKFKQFFEGDISKTEKKGSDFPFKKLIEELPFEKERVVLYIAKVFYNSNKKESIELLKKNILELFNMLLMEKPLKEIRKKFDVLYIKRDK